MTPFLFVYGTLLPDAIGALGVKPRTKLAASGTYLGEATVAGVLVDLGDYPGLLVGSGLVQGGIYRLDAPERTFAWLDQYEGISGTPGDEYERRVMTVTCDGGIQHAAWVYVMVASAAGRPVISSGRWHSRAT